MRVVDEVSIQGTGTFATSPEWRKLRADVLRAVGIADWPPGSGSFTIHPVRMGNGVAPIKRAVLATLRAEGWTIEGPAKNAVGHKLGEYDAVFQSSAGPVIMEWETGHITSSHRSINKMVMQLSEGVIAGALVIIPMRALARYLTDRIGNMEELHGYWNYWRKYPIDQGVLDVIGFQHDAESSSVPKIPKGSDGNAPKPKHARRTKKKP